MGRDSATVERCTHLAACADVGAALWTRAESDSFDLGRDWFELLASHGLTADQQPCYYMASRAGSVQCVLPLLVRQGHVSSLTSCYSSLYRPILAPTAGSEDVSALARRVVADHRCAAIRLNAMDPGHPSFDVTLAGLREAGLTPYTFFDFGNWYLPVTGGSAGYFDRLPSRLRNTIRRRSARFEKSGGRIEILHDAADVRHAISVWDRVYRCSWKRPEPFPHFVPELIELCARRGWLRFGVAYCDEVPIAAQIWIVNGGRAAIYKLAYDQAHASLSAGTLLSARLMGYVLDIDGVREVDYLIGDDPYKADWMSHRRERRGIIAFNKRTLRGRAGSIAQALSGLRRRLG